MFPIDIVYELYQKDKEKFCVDAKNWVAKYADMREEIKGLKEEGLSGDDAILKLVRCGKLWSVGK